MTSGQIVGKMDTQKLPNVPLKGKIGESKVAGNLARYEREKSGGEK